MGRLGLLILLGGCVGAEAKTGGSAPSHPAGGIEEVGASSQRYAARPRTPQCALQEDVREMMRFKEDGDDAAIQVLVKDRRCRAAVEPYRVVLTHRDLGTGDIRIRVFGTRDYYWTRPEFVDAEPASTPEPPVAAIDAGPE